MNGKETSMYTYFEDSIPACISTYSQEELQNNLSYIEDELERVFCNIFGAYNKTDILNNIYREYTIWCDDELIIMLDIENTFENCNVQLNEEHFERFVTVQDIFDEVTTQILNGGFNNDNE
jgi:hypothetical protein